MAKFNIKKNDKVLILVGKDNGKVSSVLSCFPKENKVTVKGVNIIVKHNKPKSAQDKGGIVKKEGKIDVSNVMVVCSACNKATKIKYGKNEKGEKIRFCKKCNAALDGSSKKVLTKKSAEKSEEKLEISKPEKAVPLVNEKKLTLRDTQKIEAKKTNIKTKNSGSLIKKASNTAKKIGGK